MQREGKCSEVKRVVLFIVNASSGGNVLLVLHFVLFLPFSKLQSDLRTTNLEELKITVESYFEEVARQLHQQPSAHSTVRLLLVGKKQNFLPGVISPLTVSAVSDPAVEDAAGSFREEVCVSVVIQSSLCV